MASGDSGSSGTVPATAPSDAASAVAMSARDVSWGLSPRHVSKRLVLEFLGDAELEPEHEQERGARGERRQPQPSGPPRECATSVAAPSPVAVEPSESAAATASTGVGSAFIAACRKPRVAAARTATKPSTAPLMKAYTSPTVGTPSPAATILNADVPMIENANA